MDTKISVENNDIMTSVYKSENKLPTHWSSKVPKKYKRNAINAGLHRAKNIASNFHDEKIKINKKNSKAGFPSRFIDSVVRTYENHENRILMEENEYDEMIIPTNFFDLPKKFVSVSIPYRDKNENLSEECIEKFHHLTDNKFILVIKWNTKKIRSLFKLKSKNPHPSCKIYFGRCSCGETYIDETARDVESRWGEHNSLKGNSEPSVHLQENLDHVFDWSIILPAPTKSRKRKMLEATQIALEYPLDNCLQLSSVHP